MARGVISTLVQISRQMEREAARRQREAARTYAVSVREAESARKADERAHKQAQRARATDRKRLEKEAKVAHIAAMEAEVESRNSELAAINDEIDSLLAATLEVDDYVDLEKLRRTQDRPPFDRPELEVPTPEPIPLSEPDEPALTLPEPKGLFRRKKKHADAVAKAEQAHAEARAQWESEVTTIRQRDQENRDNRKRQEEQRLVALERERTRFAAEIAEHNQQLDTFIANLGYGTPEAVQEYVQIVVSNSVYPEHFTPEHAFTFAPSNAELTMRVVVPPPNTLPSVKTYKYKKSADEITETALSQKDRKDRYARAVHQVALRSFHEVFEADRRGIIRTISLEVGTHDIDPATGLPSYIPFVAAATVRDDFNAYDLSAVVPEATLKLLGAAISKNPHGLVAAETKGVRRS